MLSSQKISDPNVCSLMLLFRDSGQSNRLCVTTILTKSLVDFNKHFTIGSRVQNLDQVC